MPTCTPGGEAKLVKPPNLATLQTGTQAYRLILEGNKFGKRRASRCSSRQSYLLGNFSSNHKKLLPQKSPQ